MEVFLRGVLRDLERRSTVIRVRLAAVSGEPDLRVHVYIDLTDVTGIRSVVLGMLATVVGTLRQNGCPLVFINPTSATRQQMQQHGLEGLLQLDPA